MKQTIDIKKIIVQEITMRAIKLKDKHTKERDNQIDYVCIYSQSQEEYEELLETTKKQGMEVKNTDTGFFYEFEDPIKTVVGDLKYIKIRKPFSTHPQRGHADFLVSDFQEFKKEYQDKEHFELFKRTGFEMIELKDSDFNVRVYFPSLPTEERLKI